MTANRLLLIALLVCCCAEAQTNPNLEQGFKPYGSYDVAKLDSVNLLNGNLTVTIPLINYPQRGSLHHNIAAVYNNKAWSVFEHCNNLTQVCSSKWQNRNLTTFGMVLTSDDAFGFVPPFLDPYGRYIYSLQDYAGGSHQFGNMGADPSRSGYSIFRTMDGSGYSLSTNFVSNISPQGAPVYKREGNGNLLWSPIGNGSSAGNEDTDGNMIIGTDALSVTDTVGRSISYPSYTSADTSGCHGPRAISGATITTMPGPNGGTAQIKLCKASVALTTKFGAVDENGNLIAEASFTPALAQAIIIYDGNSWSTSPQWIFEYADNADCSNYGDLTKITLPTGGSISYTWVTDQPCSWMSAASGTPASRSAVSRSVDANDGLGPQTTLYSYGSGPVGSIVKISTDSLLNDTVHTFSNLGYATCAYYETQTQEYQGPKSGNNLLRTVATQYTYTNADIPTPDGLTTVFGVLPSVITTTLGNGKVSQIQRDYVDSNGSTGALTFLDDQGTNFKIPSGKIIEERVYDYGIGAPGPLLKRTHSTYLAFQNSNYFNLNMLDRVSGVSVYDGSSVLKAQTTYGYDASCSLQSSGISVQRDSAIGCMRGDQTSASKWISSVSGSVTTATSYYDTGLPFKVTDPGGHATTYSYSGAYAGRS